MSASNDDTVLPPPRKPIVPSGLDGETVLPSNNTTGIHNPGDVIDNRYKVIREIGRGGMGVVYEVEDELAEGRSAIKRLLPELSTRQDIVEVFKREGKNAMRFTAESPRFVTMRHLGNDTNGLFLVMDFVEDLTLRTYVQSQPAHRLSVTSASAIMYELATALSDLHRLGFVHRDLKPENIFVRVDADGVRIRLVDFGLTKDDAEGTRTSMRGAGTSGYASPEQRKGLPTTAATDIYAFGVIAYEMLTGELPSFGDRLTDYVPAASPELVRLVTACLAGKAEKRPQNGDQLVSQFATLVVKRDQSEKPTRKVAVPEPDLPEPQPIQPTVVRTTLSFEGVQAGAVVEVDKTILVKPFVYTAEIEANARKPVSVLIRWQDQVVFEKQITLVAGVNQSLKVPQDYRVECDVPALCSVKDSQRNNIRFPVKDLLSGSPVELTYVLVYAGAEFGKLSITPKPGANGLPFQYGIGTLTFEDVPSGCRVLVNGTEKGSAYTVPIAIGVPATLSLCVKDRNHVEVYRETLTIVAGETKTIRVPKPVPAATTVGSAPEPTLPVSPVPNFVNPLPSLGISAIVLSVASEFVIMSP